MIYDKIANCSYYTGLSERFEKAFAYLKSADLNNMPEGRYEIDGEDVYVLIQHMRLKAWEEGVWEAHEKYADIQLVLSGEEILGFAPAANMAVQVPYDEKRDCVLFDPSEIGTGVDVGNGDFMIFFPQDAHRPGIRRKGAEPGTMSRRAVVKVKL